MSQERVHTVEVKCYECIKSLDGIHPCAAHATCEPDKDATLFAPVSNQGLPEPAAAVNYPNSSPKVAFDFKEAAKIGGLLPETKPCAWVPVPEEQKIQLDSAKQTSNGSTAIYYRLPSGVTELQHLISHRDMNAQIGEIFRACYRFGIAAHSDKLRDAKKIKFYAEAEIARLEKLIKEG